MNQADERLINEVAIVWIDGGGDSEGIEWLWRTLRDRVKELEEERNLKDQSL